MSRRSHLTLLLVALLLGCAGPTGLPPPNPAQIRIADGPPLAADLEPEQRQLQPATGSFYRIRPGDTLWAVATAHNLDVEQLAKWNRITRPDQLFVGQHLRIAPP
ncbi:MAG: LysM peptidoglycan-binding domain-containing protein, partial [Magnetococcales bacterium]|nr:LysM peptidoglycan-binding domain-containing protein [Magnetococcales bacterium]